MRRFLPLAAALIVLASPAAAVTVHVPTDYTLISQGLVNAGPGDTVLVAPGVYHELSLSPPEGVLLRGGGASPDGVVIDGQSIHRVMVLGGVSAATQVENLTLRGGAVAGQGGNLYLIGSHAVFRDCVIETGHATRGGGAYTVGAAAPRFERCVFRNNSADQDGAGVLHEGGEALFVDCDFIGNIAEERGGGIRVEVGTVRLEGCRFDGNYGNDTGGGVDFAGRLELDDCHFTGNSAGSYHFISGGGAALRGETAELLCENSTFHDNRGGRYGGAILIEAEASTTIRDCLFTENYSRYDGALSIIGSQYPTLERLSFVDNADPAAFFDGDSADAVGSVTLRDCLFHDNGCYSGLIVSYWLDLALDGCTLAQNRHSNFGYLRCYYSPLILLDTLIVGNETGQLVVPDGLTGLYVNCTNIHDNADGDWTGILTAFAGINGNLATDPLFCDALADDFSLEAHSPCLPAHNDCGSLIGAFGEGCEAVTATGEAVPARTRLVGASPNPFNPSTRVDFELEKAGRVELAVFDAAGRRLRTLVDGPLPAGPHTLRWNGRDDVGHRLASGVYLLHFEAAGRSESEKLVLLQ